MRQRRMATVLAAAVFGAALCGAEATAAAKIGLRLRLKKGQSYTLRQTAEQMITQTLMGRKIQIEQRIGMGFLLEVQDVGADGVAAVKTTIQSIRYKMKSQFAVIEYDSAKPPETIPLPARGFAAMVGQSFTMQLTDLGSVKKIQGGAAMLEQAIKKSGLPDGPAREAMKTTVKNQFGDEAFRQDMEKLTRIYPAVPVGIGDTWTQKLAVTKGFPIVYNNTLTLKGRADGVATIAAEAKFSPNEAAGPVKLGGMTVRYRLSGNQKGTIRVDEATGWMLGGKFAQELSGQFQISGAPGQGEGMTIPISVKGTLVIEGARKK